MKIFAIILALAVSASVYYAKYGHQKTDPRKAAMMAREAALYGDAELNPYFYDP